MVPPWFVTGTVDAAYCPLAPVVIAASGDAPIGVIMTVAPARPPPRLLVTAPLIVAYWVGTVMACPPWHEMQAKSNAVNPRAEDLTTI